ncbi:hypothetical protein [Terracidiphilus gabretensis]|jgi:hypothetical protein|uniref:hypothetical protein n=1 Tax=Terracidiphilus gabretensis TaxID=1577687 RepID=UPI00071B4CC8|nr:hypothetical protein [Terracidiphilus gabretensis]
MLNQMSDLLLDNDDLSHLQSLSANRPHRVNSFVIHAQETLAEGGKVILFHTEDGQKIKDETVSTTAELDDFIGKHFPAYLEETNAIVDAIRRESEGRTS